MEGLEPERCLERVIRDQGRPVVNSVILLDMLDVRRTRLITRVRMRPSLRLSALLVYLAMDLGELWMMLGIKARAERNPVPPPSHVQAPHVLVHGSSDSEWSLVDLEGP